MLDRARAWRLPVGAAAAIVVVLLLLDVRVEVGESPASAESRTELSAPSEQPVPGPASPADAELQVRRFAWAPAAGASRYRVEIFEGPTRIFVAETTRPQIAVPKSWRYAGAARVLRPGEYRWYVWPIVSGRRASRALVQASLSIPTR